jgi:putative ABC transport system permease protein
MRLVDCIASAAESLRANLLRSALTALGIIIGVGAVIAMVAVGAGAENQVETVIKRLGSNILIVANGTRRTAGVRSTGTRPSLTEDDARALGRELASVQVAAGEVRETGQIVFGNSNWFTTFLGVMPEYFETRDWDLAEGRLFGAEDDRTAGKVAVIGRTIVKELFGGTSPVGQTIRIQRVPFTIVGVLAEKGQTAWGRDLDDVVFVPMNTAKQRVLGGRKVQGDLVRNITVKAASADLVATAEKEVAELLRRRHRLTPGEADDFYIRNLAQVMDARAQSSRVMSMMLASVAGISLLVGGIGIMNIMLVSVTERTREIGLRIAVGARRRDIMMQFVAEALSLSLIGGAIGVAIGIGGSILVARVADWPVIIGPEAVVIAAAFSAAIGVFFGYYPARKAARLDPIEALRQE